MTFEAQYTLANDAAFVARITQASITSAKNVMAETAGTTGHTQRTNFARDVLRSSASWGPIIAQGVASNPAITDQSSDSDIQFTVNSLWDAYSGVIL